MNKFILVVFLSLGVQGCSEKKAATTTLYFSVPSYFTQQTGRLRSADVRLTRKVDFKGNTEEKTITNPEWEKELKPFSECDLNLPAWKNGFEVDTAYANGLRTITYKAREKRITIRELQLVLSGDSVQRISVVYLKSNPWYSLGRKLTYSPDKGYTIIIEQDTPLQAPETIRLEGRFH